MRDVLDNQRVELSCSVCCFTYPEFSGSADFRVRLNLCPGLCVCNLLSGRLIPMLRLQKTTISDHRRTAKDLYGLHGFRDRRPLQRKKWRWLSVQEPAPFLRGMRCRKGVSNRSNTDPIGETRNHEVCVTKLMRCL